MFVYNKSVAVIDYGRKSKELPFQIKVIFHKCVKLRQLLEIADWQNNDSFQRFPLCQVPFEVKLI